MSVETSFTAVENLIAEHVAASFGDKDPSATAEGTAIQIRKRITDQFRPASPDTDQDNSPPAILALYNRLFSAFSLTHPASPSKDRTPQLDLLHETLRELRREATGSPQAHVRFGQVELLLERQQLALKNEFTIGFGRIETWLVSAAALTLVLFNAIDLIWALPILALTVGRSWHLDRQCKKRSARIAEIDAIASPPTQKPRD